MLEIIDKHGDTQAVLVNAILDHGYHMASWDTGPYDSGQYSYRFRFNDFSQKGEIVLQKA